MLQACSPTQDTICLAKDFSKLRPQLNLGSKSVNVAPSDGVGDASNGHLIPIYCSVLAIVICCLVAYVIYRRRQLWQQKQEKSQKEATADCEEVGDEELALSDGDTRDDVDTRTSVLGNSHASNV
ncbi:PREDICTED: death domain-containing membrane protein NRADD-like [Priapulus caudatus]|uniref:Death domain-containing membrane protein NRADD-like n=1 Tax=Priapulus caudatus TaxID=37621 RepID=A0ABM1EUD1_PRICU|nr:PREDICTED: death domain-containing membrane protein NRADD-like [Priapulus caudatus]